MRLVKDARLLLPLTEVMKIARLTSPLLDVPRQSSPRPRLRHGRRLALLFYPNLALNLYTLFFVLSWFFFLVFLFYSNCSSPSESASVYAIYLRSHFSVSQPKAMLAESGAIFPRSAEPRALRSLIRHFPLLSLRLNFLRLPPTFPRPLPLAHTKSPIVATFLSPVNY